MLKNVYAPLSGGILQERVMEIISNNLANTNTTAFKEDEISFQEQEANPWPSYAFPHPPAPFKINMQELWPLKGNEMNYVTLSEIKTAHTQGPVRKTSNSTDIAIQGDGFFEVMTPFGERLTRDGGFSISNDGILITKNGAVVQGENGAISGLGGKELSILPTGEIYVGKKFIDKLKIVSFEDTKLLERLGENLWIHNGAPENLKAPSGDIAQGYLEGSNVNPMRNLTNLIIAHRSYEALQKTVKAHDDTMQNANKISEI
ncbi:flagellar hook-basal body protein [Fluviispira sanaruensis]|uniref:Flagellar basal-body rod protein FlgF n=1 Tax=Fluviispira sanaruensis TaxID=2493639 RepID=A0A4P2VHI6_FLUSA|nr:flagellar hook-basal body protein [Fluviispira sanaruensis]BBH52181.1 flagellar basal-body rod protein FlgF [Fluviispira sanaruensis]